MKNNKVVTYIIFTLLALAAVFPISKGEQTTEATEGNSGDSSLSLEFTNYVASVDTRPEDKNGTFASSTNNEITNSDGTTSIVNNDIKISVPAGNYYGYQLFISSDNDTGELKGRRSRCA
ncbi:MAG: hypothetical protein Q4B65_02535 [Candidatus Saccharibacteria bacterium]|nr:hypothetical protein [Candidatus Saccharibacteria bacterium]